jgi:lincosamide nucleotidyltransferase A/C/D/E
MNETQAVDLLKKISERTIEVWITGGWGVDALVGRQTRPHGDIDLFVQWKDDNAVTDLLRSDGFVETTVEFTTEGHTAWIAADGRVVDLHLFEFTPDGMVHFLEWTYPASLLDARGTIGGMEVRCLTANAQLTYHQGYEHDENDMRDVLLLCETFGLPLPHEYSNTPEIVNHQR